MIKKYLEHEPIIPESCYIDEAATVIGNVRLGENVSVWSSAVIRGDENSVEIGDNSNVQDCACIHVENKVKIGKNVSVAHGAIIHGATIGDNVIVGMGAIILDDAVIGDNCVVAAGSLVTGRKVFESGSMIMGSPAKKVRDLREDEYQWIKENAETYLKLQEDYKENNK